ncbi:DUF3576 domain-containing protein [Meridianimarinicoccus sp. RP-17]|uniref:DUF3576 domain-containing protein n=1 Tax=Meridianimarinicoccus zhengii TaxID=2056810 RepID=UPI001F417B8B|nr:DUF3576 domain-containing protein [Phycocomes zhengii]
MTARMPRSLPITLRHIGGALALLALASCGGVPASDDTTPVDTSTQSSIFDLFQNNDDPNVTLEVNRYLWNATQDVLGFLPLERADPFTGLLVYGYGTPPGGGRAYRATVQIRDPALDARALNLALATRNGPASAETTRAVEDAIMTRARQLRIADGRL